MKRVVSIILVFIVLTLSGCNFSSDTTTYKYDHLFENENVGQMNNKFSLTESDKEAMEKQIESLDKVIESDTSSFFIITQFNKLQSNLLKANEQYTIIFTYYCMFPSNKEIYDDYAMTLNLQTYLFEQYNKTLIRLLDSKFSDSFFDKEDDFYAELLFRKDKYDEEYYSLVAQNEILEMEFTQLMNLGEEKEDELENKYIEMINVKNSIAKKLDYNNYLEYAYDSYNREFTYADLTNLNDIIKNELVDSLIPLRDSVYGKVNNLSNENKSKFDKLKSQSSTSILEVKNEIDALASFIGGEYEENYNYFWDKGDYYFGNSSSRGMAYKFSSMSKKTLIAYFGPGYYSNLFTYTHEFGHYAAGIEDISDDSNDNLELAEFQAQSNELLLTSFMRQNNEGNIVYETVALEKLYNSLLNIFVSTLVNEFEYRVYTDENLTVSELKNTMFDVLDFYNAKEVYDEVYPEDYDSFWQRRAGNNPGYYIAYSISLIPSIEMYFVAEEDLNSTKDIYNSIMKGQNELFTTLDTINFSNPVNTNILSELINKIENLIK